MNTQYFANPELSKLLQERGMVSQFEFYWCGKKLKESWQLAKQDSTGRYSNLDEHGFCQQAIHFSDLLLPDNAKKIWPGSMDTIGEWQELSGELLYRLQEGLDWNSWLLTELSK